MSNPDKNSIKKVVSALIKGLSERNRDIIFRRFGLKSGQKETLESIGQSYNVTRERIRQIEEYSLKNLRSEAGGALASQTKPYFDLATSIISEHGGFLPETVLFKKFSGDEKNNLTNLSLAFLLSLNPVFSRTYESDDFNTFWSLDDDSFDSADKLIGFVVSAIESKKSLLSKEELYEIYKSKSKRLVSSEEFLALAAVSKKINCNIFGQYGLTSWAEVKPRGVRDKAYLVLKRESKPKHFREIASLINKAQFSDKKANIQTVHNELIKDVRFVLVGRGMYGLSEWGYKAGTVKEVLIDVLKEARKSLPKEVILAKVLSSRYVKENTVLLNLQDSKVFKKKEDGTYSLREA